MRHFSQNLLLLGCVTDVKAKQEGFVLRCRSGDEFCLTADSQTVFEVLKNLGGENQDRVLEPEEPIVGGSGATKSINKYIQVGQMLAVKGLFQLHQENGKEIQGFLARNIYLLGSDRNSYNFEVTHWWLSQIDTLGERWLDMLFGNKREYDAGDFAKFYQTKWNIIGLPGVDNRQEMATLARLIYVRRPPIC